MRLWKAWIVATKDFSVFRKNKSIFSSIIAILDIMFPLAMLLILPADAVTSFWACLTFFLL